MPCMPAAMAYAGAASARQRIRRQLLHGKRRGRLGDIPVTALPRAYACHIAELTAELLHAPLVQDYCCTQPCEGQNGLLAYDRTPKVPLELIWKANEG